MGIIGSYERHPSGQRRCARTKLLFVGTFFSILMLPMLQQAIGIFPEQPVNENRRLAAPPRVADGFANSPSKRRNGMKTTSGSGRFLYG